MTGYAHSTSRRGGENKGRCKSVVCVACIAVAGTCIFGWQKLWNARESLHAIFISLSFFLTSLQTINRVNLQSHSSGSRVRFLCLVGKRYKFQEMSFTWTYQKCCIISEHQKGKEN